MIREKYIAEKKQANPIEEQKEKTLTLLSGISLIIFEVFLSY